MLDRDDSSQAFTNIITSQIIIFFFENLILTCIIIDNTSKSRTETLFMSTTFMSVDIIGKTHHRFMVAGRILHSNFD